MKPICSSCGDKFEWNDRVIIVGDEIYHDDCVKLYPTGYVAYTEDGDYIGETDNDDGQDAYDIFDDLLDGEGNE